MGWGAGYRVTLHFNPPLCPSTERVRNGVRCKPVQQRELGVYLEGLTWVGGLAIE